MKQRLLCVFAIILIASLFAACSDSDDGSVDTDLVVSPTGIAFDSVQTATVSVEFQGAWTASLSDTTWCALDRTSGVGPGEILVTLKPREGLEPKRAELTIRATDAPSVFKVVTLSLSRLNFYADPIRVEFGLGENTSDTVVVVCAGSWTAELTDASWCTIDKTSGNGNDRIVITTQGDKTSWGSEAALLTITSVENPGLSTTVDVNQVNEYKHGSCIILNKATKGKGINFIITGDGFTKEEMVKDGRWQTIFEAAENGLFMYEPFKTYRDYFNVYAVTAVSESKVFGSGSETSKTFWGVSWLTAEGNAVGLGPQADEKIAFVANAASLGEENGEPVPFFLCVIMDDDSRYGGIGDMLGGAHGCMGTGIGSTWYGMSGGIYWSFDRCFSAMLAHEFLGHAFGKLADEYERDTPLSEEDKEIAIRMQETRGWNLNVTFTDNPSEFKNQAWAQLLEMDFPMVDVIQGANYTRYGAWRSIEDNMMRNHVEENWFGPVNQELILRQIYKYAGMEDEYNLDVFLKYVEEVKPWGF